MFPLYYVMYEGMELAFYLQHQALTSMLVALIIELLCHVPSKKVPFTQEKKI